jgi:hypothetical protein
VGPRVRVRTRGRATPVRRGRRRRRPRQARTLPSRRGARRPYPETYFLEETDPAEAADALGFPLVVKPARKREFEEVVGTNVVEVADRDEFAEIVATAQDQGVRILTQEKVETTTGEDHSLAYYVPPAGDPFAVVGNPLVRYPLGYGTSNVVDAVDRPVIQERATAVIEDAGYHGISESEFVYDADREEFVLLDVNTRPWKWIDIPVTVGVNLPAAAYADAVDRSVAPRADGGSDASAPADSRWVYLPDYLSRLFEDPTFDDVLDDGQCRALLSGSFEDGNGLTTGVYRPSDPGAYAALEAEFAEREYYCSC